MRIAFDTTVTRPTVKFGDDIIREMGYIMSGGECSYPKEDTFEAPEPSEPKPSWNKKQLRIPLRSPEEMHDLAEYFHRFNNMELLGVCAEAYILTPWKIHGTYKKLSSAVKEVKAHREKLEEAEKAQNKILSANQNMELAMLKKGEKIIDKEFTEKLQAGQTPVNGFFVYGNSEKKEGIPTHLYVDVKYDVKPIELERTFKENNIEKIYSKLQNFAQNTLEKSQSSNLLHGVFIIDNFDLFLQSPKNRKEKEIQNEFNRFIKTCASQYKTTIVGISNATAEEIIGISSPLGELKPIYIHSAISEEEKREHKKIQDELNRLNQKAAEVVEKFAK